MLSDEVIDKVTERLVKRMEQGNTMILKKIGESVKEIKDLSPSSVHALSQIMEYGGDYDKIVNELSKITSINVQELNEIFKEVAKNDYQFAEKFYKYKNIKYIPFEENIVLQNQISELARTTSEKFMNMSNTRMIGFNTLDLDGNVVFKDLKQTYTDLMDVAVLNVNEGTENFDSAMSTMLEQVGRSGLQVVNFESGRSYRLDSAIKMNLKGALRDLHNTMQIELGEEFGADGVEISVHSYPAPDHEDAQGRQFSYEEFEKLQSRGYATDCKDKEISMLRTTKKGRTYHRPISMYNCYHYVFSIVLGVNEPQYSEEQLNEINSQNDNGFDFEDKHYSLYEGSQLQRQIERTVRNWKDVQTLAKASDNEELFLKSQDKITKLTQKYKELSDASGLPTYMERMRIVNKKT